MNKKKLTILLLILISIVGVVYGLYRSGLMPNSHSEPWRDVEVGASEKDLILKYGKPSFVVVKSADQYANIGAEEGVSARIGGGKTPVKELYYKFLRKEQWFWLAQNSNGVWTVFTDIDLPNGAAF